jgi:DNA-binding transcriptional regulator YbjK
MTADLEQRVTKLEADMETTQAILRQLAESQVRTDQNLDRLSQRVDSFVYEAQRLLTNQGGKLERAEAALETLAATAQRHDRELREDRQQSQESQMRMDSMISRLDALVNYLMQQR